MTKKDFDNYQFSINTQVKWRGAWYGLTTIYFDYRKVNVDTGHLVSYEEIEAIRQKETA